jgi:hypothetical protein
MSLTIWTPAEASSNARPLEGLCWRTVEAQHHISTTKLTDTAGEQQRLEELIDATKPPIPLECRGLDFLLFTPFRYSPYPTGSRFRRAGHTAGVFYASELAQTAIAEKAFYSLVTFADSPATPWPQNAGEYTVFAAEYKTERAIDLTEQPFARDREIWTHPTHYEPCQDLADLSREARINLIRYQSVRDSPEGRNVALLACDAFAKATEVDRQTWRLQLSAAGVRAVCEMPHMLIDFDRDAFMTDPRIASMRWERG